LFAKILESYRRQSSSNRLWSIDSLASQVDGTELSFGAGTFGANNEFFNAWSQTTQEEADRIVGICIDAGLNFFDTADIYSTGGSEIALGKPLAHHYHVHGFAITRWMRRVRTR
jgi:aryl-alcohol dehydrogenase-like predicted oxidoreductase